MASRSILALRSLPLALTVGALAACPTRGRLEPLNPSTEMDAGPPADTAGADVVKVTDGGVTDTPVVPDAPDAPMLPPCPAPTTPTRTDPCAGRPGDCGLPSSARVNITGATRALTEFQVRVELPAMVRGAVGATCDRMVFRTAEGQWAPHFVTDCAMGVVWVRAPAIAPGGTTLTLRYGGATALAGANSYDDTFDRVPTRAEGILGSYSFDEGTGARTCPSAGTSPFDAYIHQDLYRANHPEVAGADPESSGPPRRRRACSRRTTPTRAFGATSTR
jgi:hypothetical protein